MIVNVLLFANLKDLVGRNRLSLPLADPAVVADVRRALAQAHPTAQAALDAAIAAVNQEYAQDTDPVRDGDEVAFFPPVSGGADYPEIARLAAEPISIDALVQAVTVPATGAVCVFSGMVRGETSAAEGMVQTHHLEYESYEPMALAKMRQVIAEIRSRWPLVQGIAIVQRIGSLDVGQNTIIIACSSGHRDQGCFEAARYGIDRLKEIVPVWKKEVRPDGAIWIEGHYRPTASDRQTID